jgi:hypothetical protein
MDRKPGPIEGTNRAGLTGFLTNAVESVTPMMRTARPRREEVGQFDALGSSLEALSRPKPVVVAAMTDGLVHHTKVVFMKSGQLQVEASPPREGA